MSNQIKSNQSNSANQFDPKNVASDDHITLSDQALTHFRKQITKRGSGIGIRLSLEKYGCNGLGYVIDIVDQEPVGDVVFIIANDFRIFIAADCFAKVRGSHIDYVIDDNGLNKSIKINNPNESGRCGCGESFNVNDNE